MWSTTVASLTIPNWMTICISCVFSISFSTNHLTFSYTFQQSFCPDDSLPRTMFPCWIRRRSSHVPSHCSTMNCCERTTTKKPYNCYCVCLMRNYSARKAAYLDRDRFDLRCFFLVFFNFCLLCLAFVSRSFSFCSSSSFRISVNGVR